MPPTATETITASLPSLSLKGNDNERQQQNASSNDDNYPYKWALPWANKDAKYPPLEPFEHVDPGHRAVGKPATFLEKATSNHRLTPKFGNAIEGVQLDQLTLEQRDELALFVAQRGVAVFYDQDFVDRDPEWLLDFGRSFNRLHIHPTTVQPREHPEFHLVYKDANVNYNYDDASKLTTATWHSDVTYELQPPGVTTLFLFDTPETGGDTVFADQRALYAKLSPSFRAYLETLSVLHSGVLQAQYSQQGGSGGTVKRQPVETVHPLVRVHPVTGEKALFVQPAFSRSIVGLKKEESDVILNLLYDHIAKAADTQLRVHWKKRTVVLWDNRITAHTATVDFGPEEGRRHGARLTPQAERPVGTTAHKQ